LVRLVGLLVLLYHCQCRAKPLVLHDLTNGLDLVEFPEGQRDPFELNRKTPVRIAAVLNAKDSRSEVAQAGATGSEASTAELSPICHMLWVSSFCPTACGGFPLCKDSIADSTGG